MFHRARIQDFSPRGFHADAAIHAGGLQMQVIHPRCAGLDVHQKQVVACIRVAGRKKVVQEVRTFETTTRDLLALSDWLASHGCTHVAMESTGVYWKPVWHVLDGAFELVLANAMHIKNIPGRKSDVNDATWISDLLAHGLIRGSFVPPSEIQELRDLTRSRKQLVLESARHVLRLQKVLEDANIKLTEILSDVMGKSGRAIIEALISGETNPEALAGLACGNRLKATREEFVEALRGRVTPHHRFLLKLHLGQIDALDSAVRELEVRMGEALSPFRESVERLKTIPGVNDTVARVIIAEVGLDMGRFPTSGHLISWAGLCPGLNESAGKRLSTRIRKGAPWLKTTLAQAAWGAIRTKCSYLRAQFHRIKSRRGPKKAIIAVAASMLTAVYHILKNHVPYRDLGSEHYDRIDKTKTASRLVKKLKNMGFQVAISPAA
jgi:transposase